jgi:hypothetical protein
MSPPATTQTEDNGSPPPGPGGAPAGTDSQVESSSFIKLAMRNMVRKGRQSLLHFGLTALGLTTFLVLIAWLGRPNLPQ